MFTLFMTLVTDPYINLSLSIIKATYFHQILTEEESLFQVLHIAQCIFKHFSSLQNPPQCFFMLPLCFVEGPV